MTVGGNGPKFSWNKQKDVRCKLCDIDKWYGIMEVKQEKTFWKIVEWKIWLYGKFWRKRDEDVKWKKKNQNWGKK